MENAKLSPVLQIALALLACFTAALNFQGCDKYKQELMEARRANQILMDSVILLRDRTLYQDSVISAIRKENNTLRANLDHHIGRVRQLDKGLNDIQKIIKAVQKQVETDIRIVQEDPRRTEKSKMIKK